MNVAPKRRRRYVAVLTQENALDRALQRAMMAIARRSGRLVAVVAVVFYPGLGLLVPVFFAWPGTWLIFINLMAAAMATALVLTWMGIKLRARDRRLLVEWTTDLRLLSAMEFEWFVGEIFRRAGWKVTETGRHDGPDGNIDLILDKDGLRRLVQCKRWTSRLVGVSEIRALAGTLARERMRTDAGILVTLSDFSPQARQEAETLGLTLLDSHDLYAQVERVRRAEPCPLCSSPMVLDRSPRGWWFRCVQTTCTGKRDLGRDPVRAVELLTDSKAVAG